MKKSFLSGLVLGVLMGTAFGFLTSHFGLLLIIGVGIGLVASGLKDRLFRVFS